MAPSHPNAVPIPYWMLLVGALYSAPPQVALRSPASVWTSLLHISRLPPASPLRRGFCESRYTWQHPLQSAHPCNILYSNILHTMSVSSNSMCSVKLRRRSPAKRRECLLAAVSVVWECNQTLEQYINTFLNIQISRR